MRKALIEIATGNVANVVEAGDTWQPPAGYRTMNAEGIAVSPGDRWDGTKFIPKLPTAVDIANQKRGEAQSRAIEAIKGNAGASPWGKILQDMAVALGWIEP